MKKMDELRTRAEGVYLEETQFELIPEVIKALDDVAKFYSYVILFEGDAVYECSTGGGEEHDKVHTGKEGLIHSLECWVYTMECNMDDVEQYRDDYDNPEEVMATYQSRCQVLNDYIKTLKHILMNQKGQ